MPSLGAALRDPFELAPNRVPRFYRGGRLLAEFRGETPAVDDHRPEDWVGSATRTWTPPGTPASSRGLSVVYIGEYALTMTELLEAEPEALAGQRDAGTLGLLVKLLDAGQRLPVHCHPTREAARSMLDSPHGKTEAWIILGTRGDARDARVWAGFREPVERSTLRGWIDAQDSAALLGSLNEHRVAAGDVVLIPGGVPHAIGEGVFLLELQEPTDFSVVAETRGVPISESDASLGLGWDRAIAFFDTGARGELLQPARVIGPGVTSLIGSEADPFFQALRLEIDGETGLPTESGFAIGVVLSGDGEISGPGRTVRLRRGVTFGVPAAAHRASRLRGAGLDVVLCLPPSVSP
jgi:mannose-6-phosphate isomerase